MLKPKKTVKKCLSWLLAFVMILSVIPVAVLAAPADLLNIVGKGAARVLRKGERR